MNMGMSERENTATDALLVSALLRDVDESAYTDEQIAEFMSADDGLTEQDRERLAAMDPLAKIKALKDAPAASAIQFPAQPPASESWLKAAARQRDTSSQAQDDAIAKRRQEVLDQLKKKREDMQEGQDD
jgi:hypothetical protein